MTGQQRQVRQRLGSAHASSVTALSLNGYTDLLPDRIGGLNSSSNSFAKSFPPPGGYSSSFNSDLLISTPNKFLASGSSPCYPGSTRGTYRGTDGLLSLDQSPVVLALISDKLEAQTRSMDQLSKTVRQLEDEKSHYQKHVRDLRDELSMLNTRMTEKGVDIGTERKIEAWKRDIMAEMQLMQSQIQLHRSDDVGNISTSILRELSETKRHVTDECDSIRLEVASLKSRLVKLEVDVSSVVSDNRDIGRRHDRIDKNDSNYVIRRSQSMHELIDSHNNNMRDVSRTMSERSHDKAELNELKSSLQSINQKLDEVQDHVLQDVDKHRHRPPRPSSKKMRLGQNSAADIVSPATTDVDDTTDSTDMLDVHSSDFSLSPQHNKSPLNAMGILSEDDLDLDLTTDDLISSYSCLDTDDLK